MCPSPQLCMTILLNGTTVHLYKSTFHEDSIFFTQNHHKAILPLCNNLQYACLETLVNYSRMAFASIECHSGTLIRVPHKCIMLFFPSRFYEDHHPPPNHTFTHTHTLLAYSQHLFSSSVFMCLSSNALRRTGRANEISIRIL